MYSTLDIMYIRIRIAQFHSYLQLSFIVPKSAYTNYASNFLTFQHTLLQQIFFIKGIVIHKT